MVIPRYKHQRARCGSLPESGSAVAHPCVVRAYVVHATNRCISDRSTETLWMAIGKPGSAGKKEYTN
ncbi:hypothetical protein DDK07_18270 [Mycobacteroides abscessus]|nr:hypothetical protein DDT48_15115 [Mycobacteroides abscessus]SIM79545.1 Uncharacterised protein [Mycobacteroides abscessus subsp. abscessus]OTQ99454.1 hypothetical protein B9M85_15055 [Mycobacteroides abscessus]OTR21856.1 hypothetical protein B9M80_15565 [Mycobacteroides abscessus]OTR28643.1 hypothetical protein B9M79_14505 [Mycobacteroides abscessus]